MRRGEPCDYVWAPERFARSDFVALAVGIAVSFVPSANISRSFSVTLLRWDFVGSKRELSPNRPHQVLEGRKVNPKC